MSPKGDGLACCGLGDSVEFGVGSAGTGGTTDERRLVRDTGALFLLRGDARFVGDAGSLGAILWSASNICDGSIVSTVFVLLPRVAFLGDGASLGARL